MTEDAMRQRAVYDEYFNYVYAIVLRILHDCGSAEDAEECVIDTFAEVLPRLHEIQEQSLKAYLGTTARHKALNAARVLRRENSRNVPMDSVQELTAPQIVEEAAEENQLRQLLLRKITELGEPDTSILIQKYYYGRNSREIAKLTGLTPAAVRQRCTRAVKHLKQELSGWELIW